MTTEQVKAAKAMNEILLSSFDMEDAVEVFVEEQVEIVGGSLMIYDIIDRAFKQQQIILFFVKETYLYNWRITMEVMIWTQESTMKKRGLWQMRKM